MHVDAILILRRRIDEIGGEAEHAGKLMPGLRVEIGVAGAGVESAVTDAQIRQPGGVIGADRYVSRGVDHVVVDALVPAQCGLRDEIRETRYRAVDGIEPRTERDRVAERSR